MTIVEIARDLLSDPPFSNTEYDRALIELTRMVLGVEKDQEYLVEALITQKEQSEKAFNAKI